MSDIFLFKAKAVACDSKKLVEGFYVRDTNSAAHGIYSDGEVRPIHESTLCVFTGKEDVDGKPICTNDIVECTASTNDTDSFFTGVCQYDKEIGRFMLFNGSVKIGMEDKSFSEKNGAYCYIGYKYRVVGNVCAKKIEFYQRLGK